LGILNSGQPKIADLEVAILVDQYVAGLQVSVHDTCRVNVFQTALHVTMSEYNEARLNIGRACRTKI